MADSAVQVWKDEPDSADPESAACPFCEGTGLVMGSDTGEACGPGYDRPDRLIDRPLCTRAAEEDD